MYPSFPLLSYTIITSFLRLVIRGSLGTQDFFDFKRINLQIIIYILVFLWYTVFGLYSDMLPHFNFWRYLP